MRYPPSTTTDHCLWFIKYACIHTNHTIYTIVLQRHTTGTHHWSKQTNTGTKGWFTICCKCLATRHEIELMWHEMYSYVMWDVYLCDISWTTVEPLITDIPNSGHLPVMDKSPCTNRISHCYNTKPTSHERTPLYSEQRTATRAPTSNGPYNFTSNGQQAESRINHAHNRREYHETDEEQELPRRVRAARATRTKDQEL